MRCLKLVSPSGDIVLCTEPESRLGRGRLGISDPRVSRQGHLVVTQTADTITVEGTGVNIPILRHGSGPVSLCNKPVAVQQGDTLCLLPDGSHPFSVEVLLQVPATGPGTIASVPLSTAPETKTVQKTLSSMFKKAAAASAASVDALAGSSTASSSTPAALPAPPPASFSSSAGTTVASSAAATAATAAAAAAALPSGPGFSLTEKLGDLFQSGDSLCHCISADCVMGKGIALEFKNRFGGVAELKAQNVPKGKTAYLKRGGRYIFYLITKDRFSYKPKYDDLRSSLEHMRALCETFGVTALSMPRLGCGLDGLDWKVVRGLIQDVFAPTGIAVTVYSK